MFEFLTDHLPEVILYTTYLKILFYLVLYLSCTWFAIRMAVEDHTHFHPLPILPEGVLEWVENQTFDFLLYFLPKSIRRKDSGGDEDDGPIFFRQQQEMKDQSKEEYRCEKNLCSFYY
jgi:hypothetical protein